MTVTTRRAIRAVVTIVSIIFLIGLANTPTFDVGSIMIVMLLIIAGTVWVWRATRMPRTIATESEEK